MDFKVSLTVELRIMCKKSILKCMFFYRKGHLGCFEGMVYDFKVNFDDFMAF